MADDETAEETPDPAPETGDGGNEESPDQDAVETPSGESAEMPVDHKEPLTPNRAAKLAGIGVLAAFLVAVIVVAALWAVDAILDDDYEFVDTIVHHNYGYYEPQDSDDAWFQYVDPSELDDDFGEHRRGRRGQLFGHDKQSDDRQLDERGDWADKDHSLSPGFSTEGHACGKLFGSGALAGPAVVVVLVDPSGWAYPERFGLDGGGRGSGGVLPNLLPFARGEGVFGGEWSEGPTVEGFLGEFGPTELGGFFGGLGPESFAELFAQEFFEDPSVLEGLFGASGLELPELQDELSLEATELDNEAPPAVEGLTPT